MVFDSRMNAILCWLHQIMEIKKQTAVKRNYSTADGNGSTSRGSSPCSWASPRRRSQPLCRCICSRNSCRAPPFVPLWLIVSTEYFHAAFYGVILCLKTPRKFRGFQSCINRSFAPDWSWTLVLFWCWCVFLRCYAKKMWRKIIGFLTAIGV